MDTRARAEHKNTCFRIDLDPSVQAQLVGQDGEDSEEEDGQVAPGRPDKPKWLLAAETVQGMCQWMEVCKHASEGAGSSFPPATTSIPDDDRCVRRISTFGAGTAQTGQRCPARQSSRSFAKR